MSEFLYLSPSVWYYQTVTFLIASQITTTRWVVVDNT